MAALPDCIEVTPIFIITITSITLSCFLPLNEEPTIINLIYIKSIFLSYSCLCLTLLITSCILYFDVLFYCRVSLRIFFNQSRSRSTESPRIKIYSIITILLFNLTYKED